MARPITTLAVFFLAFSLFSQMLISTGVAATIGIEANVGGEDVESTANSVTQDEDGAKTGAPTGDTLFGLYNVVTGEVGSLLKIFNPGLRMLNNAGVPEPITNQFLTPIVSLVKFVGLVSLVRGYDL